MTIFAPIDASVKITLLRLKNLSKTTRKLSITSYIEWVLGISHSQSAPTIITEWDSEIGGIFAENSYNNEFANRISFMTTSEVEKTFTCDRKEFIGRNGSLSHPAALSRVGLGEKCGSRLDPCTALQSYFDLAYNQEREIVVLVARQKPRKKLGCLC